METKLKLMHNKVLDEVYTPKEALDILLPFIPKDSVVWECAFGSGVLAEHLKNAGFKVNGGSDFFNENVESTILITNPPYSLKDKFLKRAFELNKPFAFLLPLTALEGKMRGELYRKHGIQLIIPNGRINFDIASGKKNCWFATAWFTHGLNLENDLNFVKIK